MNGNNPLKLLSISDIHLGHKQVSTQHIVNNLNYYLPDNNSMLEIDIIFLVGDIFDDVFSLRDDNTGIIQRFIVRLLKLCKKYDIVLRVLEGTPSHDGKQSKQFQLLNEFLKIDTDILYVDTLSIEYINRFNINVLYIPDKWRGSCEQTQNEVIRLLHDNGLSQVDYSLIHGQFKHQLPELKTIEDFHNSDFYLSITRKYIFVGHIHFMSQFKRILAQGSFDRLRHNEEGPKGFLYVESYQDIAQDVVCFKENKHAAIFKKIFVEYQTQSGLIATLNKLLLELQQQSNNFLIPCFIMLVYKDDCFYEDVFLSYKKTYLKIKWTIKKETKITTINENLSLPNTYTIEAINPNSILSIIQHRLKPLMSNNNLQKTLTLCDKIKNQLG